MKSPIKSSIPVRRLDLLQAANHRERNRRQFVSMFRNSVAKRLVDTGGWSTKQMQEASEREARKDLVAKVEPLVRDRLHKEFPREFQASWFSDSYDTTTVEPMTVSSVKNLLALNGFQKVAKPSQTRLYLAEGVVATPPIKLSFNAKAIPFASGYQEFTKGMEMDNVGVFGDVHKHIVEANQTKTSKEFLFAQPLERSHLHPDDGIYQRSLSPSPPPPPPPSPITNPKSKAFPDFVQQDITLYRMAENSAAMVLDSTYSRWKALVDRTIVKPVENTIESVHAMHTRFHETLEKSLVERIWEAVSTELSKIHDRYERHSRQQQQQAAIVQTTGDAVVASLSPELSTPIAAPIMDSGKSSSGGHKKELETIVTEEPIVESPTTTEMSAPENAMVDETNLVDVEKKIDDPLETLVVISSRPTADNDKANPNEDEIIDSMSLYRRMTPSTRILALPNYYVLRHSSASTLVSVSLVVFGALPLAYRSYIFSIDYDWLVGSELVATSVVGTITYGIVSWRWKARTSQSKQVHQALGARVGARDEAALLLLKEGAIRSVVDSVVQATQQGQLSPTSSLSSDSDSLIDPMEWAQDFGMLEEKSTEEATATGNA